jgi:hypothetical protein
MRTESKRHQEVKEYIARLVDGVNEDYKNRKLNEYFPDVHTKDCDIEVEVYNQLKHLRYKARKWDKKRRKVLIITVPQEIDELFDEIIFYNPKTDKDSF